MEQPRILIVDDEANLRNLMKAALKKKASPKLKQRVLSQKGYVHLNNFHQQLHFLTLCYLVVKAMIYVKKSARHHIFQCCFIS